MPGVDGYSFQYIIDEFIYIYMYTHCPGQVWNGDLTKTAESIAQVRPQFSSPDPSLTTWDVRDMASVNGLGITPGLRVWVLQDCSQTV